MNTHLIKDVCFCVHKKNKKEGDNVADDKIYYCVGCGKIHPKGDFYVSYSKTHANGRLPYCKNFIKKQIYKNDNEVDIKKLQSMLMQLNIPFLNDTYESAIASNGDIVGHYFRLFNSLPQNRGLTWGNSVFLNEDKAQDIEKENIINKIEEIDMPVQDIGAFIDVDSMQEAVNRWGNSYDLNQIAQLERFYKSMKDANEIETPQDISYLEKLALISLKMNEELEKGNYAQSKQLGDLFSKYMADSQFRAIDKTDADKTGGIRTFGSIYKEVEKDGHIPPWEYYRKIKGLTQDILDKTIMHIENFTLRFNKAEVMTTPPNDTPKVSKDEVDYEAETSGGGY